MGFFKKLKKTVRRVVKKTKKQLKRKPTAERAQKSGIRTFARVSREATRAISRSGLPPEVIQGILLSLGPVGAGIQAGLEAGKTAELVQAEAKRFLRAKKSLQAAQLGPQQMGFFSSLGTSLLDPGKGLLTDVVAPVAGQLLVGQATQLTQRAFGQKPPRRRAAPVAAQAAPAFFPQLPTQGQAIGAPPIFSGGFQQRLSNLDLPPRFEAQTGGGMLPGVRVEVPRFARSPDERPAGSERLQAILLADGTVGFVVVKKRRRMNVLNPKALNRAVRRVDGFTKFVKRSRKGLKKLAKL